MDKMGRESKVKIVLPPKRSSADAAPIGADSFEQLFPLPRQLMELEKEGDAQELFYFHEHGDFLKGKLIGTRKRKSLHYETKTYLIKAYEIRQDGRDMIVSQDGQIVEFPGNLKLRQILEDHELIGSRIKIVFTGKRGRYKKYDVFKDIGTFREREYQKHGITKRKRSRSKTG